MKKQIRNILVLSLFLSVPSLQAAIPPVKKEITIQADSEIYPVVILGSGIGALTSAIYLQRAGVDTLVIEGRAPGGTIVQSPKVENWPGELVVNGHELADKVHRQAKANGATFLAQEVISVDFTARPYVITTHDLAHKGKIRQIKAHTCIIALGSTPNRLGIVGEEEKGGYWAHGVYTCATCDGSLFKNKTVAVVGGGDAALIEADYLSNLAKHVYIIVRGSEFRNSEEMRRIALMKKHNITVLYNTQVQEIQGNGKKVTHLVLSHEKIRKAVDIDGVFLAIGAKPNSSLFKNQLEIDQQGYIVLKNGQETSKKGVFAIGDIVDHEFKQAISAAGDGAKAAIQAERQLSSLDLETVKIQNNLPETEPSSYVIEPNNEEDFKTLIKGPYVIVEFYSPTCGPCKRITPLFEKIAKEKSGNYQFLKVNINNFSDLTQDIEIVGVPTMIVYKNGVEVERKVGVEPIQDLLNKLE